jgi:hypothetical protein
MENPEAEFDQKRKSLMTNDDDLVAGFMLSFVPLASLYPEKPVRSEGKRFIPEGRRGRSGQLIDYK